MLLDVKTTEIANIKITIIVGYVRSYVRFRRSELENEIDAMNWLDLGMEGKRKLACGFHYRKFNLLGDWDSGTMDFNLNFSDWRTAMGQKRRLMETVNNKVVT